MIISDSSPLIALAKIGRFELLRDLFKEIHISKAVHREVVVRGKEKTGEKEVTQGIKKGWIKVLEVKEREPYALLLGEGEGETIALAKERRARLVIMDDRKGYILAKTLGITVIGTLGVILLAYKSGMISNMKNELDNLRENGFWFSNRLYQELIKYESERE
jgi:predicted nucleic acid-binding protein